MSSVFFIQWLYLTLNQHDTPNKKYQPSEIYAFCKALQKNKEAYEWLKEQGCKELATAADILLVDSRSALNSLVDYKYKTILAFLDAVDDYDGAFNFLMKMGTKSEQLLSIK